jgi:outer membrane receptor for ferrienterochelin and colicin
MPIALLFVLASFASLTAHSDTTEQLFDLSLQQLMYISVVSKHPEDPSQAPGIVSIITQEHIQRYGGLNLGDLIDRLPNTQVMGSSLYPRNRTSLRAVTQTHIDDKILVLLDGRPMRDAGQGGVNGDLYATFPIDSIEQIEVIRGPGSVLYGTNAFAGVLNIVTKSEKAPVVNSQIRAGSNGDSKLWASAHQAFGQGSLALNLQTISHSGDSYTGISGELGDPGEHGMGYDNQLIHVKGNYDATNISALVSNTRIDSANNLQSYPSEDWDIERRFLDIGRDQKLTEHTDFQLNLTINQMENKAFILSQSVGSAESFFVTDSTSYLLDTSIQSKLNNETSFILGSSYDSLQGDNVSAGTLNTDIDSWRYTAYSQVNHKISTSGRLIAGIQYHKTKEGHSDTSPRAMYIHTLTAQQTIKVGYDEAYRSPFGLDLFLNASFLQGDVELEPETIRTYSIQHSFSSPVMYFASTLYSSRQENMIVRDETQSPVKLQNAGHMDYAGLELEHQWKINENWNWEGNISYQENTNIEDDTGDGIAPNWMIKQGLDVQWNATQLGIYASYFGAPTDPVKLNPAVIEANKDPSSHTSVSLHLKQSLEPWLKSRDWFVSLYIDNTLDEKAFYPEIARKKVNSYPFKERRAAYLMLDYTP